MKAGNRLTSLTSVKFKLEKALGVRPRSPAQERPPKVVQPAILPADAVFQRSDPKDRRGLPGIRHPFHGCMNLKGALHAHLLTL